MDVKCWGRLFQIRAAAAGKARSPTVDNHVYDEHSATVRKASPGVDIGRVLELVGEIRRYCLTQTLVHEKSKLELDPLRLWCSEPVHAVGGEVK